MNTTQMEDLLRDALQAIKPGFAGRHELLGLSLGGLLAAAAQHGGPPQGFGHFELTEG